MAVFQVTTQDDAVNANDGVLSLREAVAQAASNAGSDTITFSSSVFTPGNGTIELTQGQLQITQAGGAVIILGDIRR